ANKRQEITADDPPATPLSASSAGASTTTTQNTPSTLRPDISMVLAATAGSEDLPNRLHRMKRLKKGTLYKAIFGWEHKGFNNDLPLPASRIVIILIDDERLKDILNRFDNYFGRALSFYNVIRLDNDRTYADLLDNLGSTAKVVYSMVPTTQWKLIDPPYLPMAIIVPSTVRLFTVDPYTDSSVNDKYPDAKQQRTLLVYPTSGIISRGSITYMDAYVVATRANSQINAEPFKNLELGAVELLISSTNSLPVPPLVAKQLTEAAAAKQLLALHGIVVTRSNTATPTMKTSIWLSGLVITRLDPTAKYVTALTAAVNSRSRELRRTDVLMAGAWDNRNPANATHTQKVYLAARLHLIPSENPTIGETATPVIPVFVNPAGMADGFPACIVRDEHVQLIPDLDNFITTPLADTTPDDITSACEAVNAAFTADLHVKLQGTDLAIASLENVRMIVTTR
ncbi:hypothetical protein VOLCADRAFT_101251, partial [Volvox carteri f. nagariensis]